MPSNHALLSPSASHRWLVCTPSVLLEAEYGEQGSSSYAQEGTFAHSVAEFKLQGEPELFEPSGEYSFDDTLRELTPYIEYCEALKFVADIWAVETRADLTDIAPDMFGTCDFHAKVGDTLYIVASSMEKVYRYTLTTTRSLCFTVTVLRVKHRALLI